MAKLIDKLIRLQEIDGEIQKLRAEMDRWPAVLAEKEKDVAVVRRTLDSKTEELRQAKVDVESLELKLKSGEEEIGKCRTTLLKIKTNREYEAVLHEIEGVKAENGLIEEKIIGGLDIIEGMEREMRGIKEEIKATESEVATLRKQAEAETAEVDAEIRDLDQDKTACEAGISPDVLAQYERIRNGRAGLAVVGVVDNVCQGCYMSLTSQEFNNLLMAEDELITCRNCQRILFLDK